MNILFWHCNACSHRAVLHITLDACCTHSCFTKDELDAIRKEHCVHVLSQYVQTIDDDHFLVRQTGRLHAADTSVQYSLCTTAALSDSGICREGLRVDPCYR